MSGESRSKINNDRNVWKQLTGIWNQVYTNVAESSYFRVALKSMTCVTLLIVGRQISRKIYRRVNKYPPGPEGIPFFGSLISVAMNFNGFFHKLGNVSPISLVYLANQPTIVLNDPKLIFSIFTDKELYRAINNRESYFRWAKSPRSLSVIEDYFEWLPRRKLFHTALPRVLNNASLDKIIDQLFNNMLIVTISKETNDFVNPWNTINRDFKIFQFCLLFQSIFGADMEDHNQDNNEDSNVLSLELMEEYSNVMTEYVKQEVSEEQKYAVYRLLGYVPNRVANEAVESRLESNRICKETFIKWMEKHSKFRFNSDKSNEIDKNERTIYVLDTLLQAMQHPSKYTLQDSKLKKEFGLESYNWDKLFKDITVIFFAGMETTSNSLQTIIQCLAKHIGLQKQIYNEITDYLTMNNIEITTKSDKNGNKWKQVNTSLIDFGNNLHKLRAFVWECLRLNSVVPLGLPHAADASNVTNNEYLSKSGKEIKFVFNGKEYVIPNNSMILLNIVFANRYAKYWINNENSGKPDAFCLSHWLQYDKGLNKEVFVKNNNFVSFGVGRRNCVGMQFAINILYRILIYLFVNFKIYGKDIPHPSWTVDERVVADEFIHGVTRTIKSNPITMVPRV